MWNTFVRRFQDEPAFQYVVILAAFVLIAILGVILEPKKHDRTAETEETVVESE